jgi:uncharacterized protein YvpB
MGSIHSAARPMRSARKARRAHFAPEYLAVLTFLIANVVWVWGVLLGSVSDALALMPDDQDGANVVVMAQPTPLPAITSKRIAPSATPHSLFIQPISAPLPPIATLNAPLTLTPEPPPLSSANEALIPTASATPLVSSSTAQPTRTRAAASPTVAPPTRTPDSALRVPAPRPQATTIENRTYEVYLRAATKAHQEYHYSCEFDAAWVVLKTYGFDVSVDEQMKIVGVDKSIEPSVKTTDKGYFIYGGDISQYWSGNFENYLARMSGAAMRKVFEHYKLKVTPVNNRAGIEMALRAGQLVWIKTTADFKPGKPATWVLPDGRTYQTVLGNDHAVTIIGFNQAGVVVRDVLGPTNTNWYRKYEYFVDWEKFLAIWAQQSNDGLAVAPPQK